MPTKLEFGNPEHIKIAEQGIPCACGHKKSDHWSGGCNEPDPEAGEMLCTCECGDEHYRTKDCDCPRFRLKEDLKFDKKRGVFKA